MTVSVLTPRQAEIRRPPPLRKDNRADPQDGQRVAWAWHHWNSQDAVLYNRDRQIEENVRMLAGQHWHFYSERLGRYVSVDDYLTEDERRWRQRPVLNRLILWFLLTHARLTENPPIIGFLPGPDRLDSELAEMLDILAKTVWREAGMADVIDRMATWLLPGGEVAFMSRIDFHRGPWREWLAEATLPVVDPATGQPGMQSFPDVPHDADGRPLVSWTPQGLQPLLGPDGQPLQPHAEREGQIVVDVLSPLEVRGEWGPSPWHEKRWHARLVHMTPEEIAEVFGVDGLQPKPLTRSGQDPGMLDRLLFGAGYYGAAERRTGSALGGAEFPFRDQYVPVLELWERPSRFPGMEERKGQPGGRYLAVAPDQVLRDGPRPAAFPYVSPIQVLEFIRLPGRPRGTSLQESLNSPQRAMNRLAGHELEHVALQAHPKGLVTRGSGLEHHRLTNKPGEHYVINPIPGKALEYVAPPALNSDLHRTHQSLLGFLTDVGNIQASPGEPPTRDASGELVKELRWDRDRWLGPMTRRFVEEVARMYENWTVLMPFIFSEERLLSYTGDDNIARTMMVRPHLFEQGKVNVVGDPESMFPEGRGERQARVFQFWQQGAFGPPGSPGAIGKMFELSRFPHLSRVAKPGGIDRTTAEQNLGAILQGALAEQIPLYPWYDLETHLEVYRTFMAGPEFKKLPPETQGQLAILWQTVDQAVFQQQMAAMMAMPPGPDGAPAPPTGGMPRRGGSRFFERAAQISSAQPPRGPVAAGRRPSPLSQERVL